MIPQFCSVVSNYPLTQATSVAAVSGERAEHVRYLCWIVLTLLGKVNEPNHRDRSVNNLYFAYLYTMVRHAPIYLYTFTIQQLSEVVFTKFIVIISSHI